MLGKIRRISNLPVYIINIKHKYYKIQFIDYIHEEILQKKKKLKEYMKKILENFIIIIKLIKILLLKNN